MVGFAVYKRITSQTSAPAGDLILPNDGRLTISDYQTISDRSSTRLRFVRSVVDGQGYEHCAPGARVSFTTNATLAAFSVHFNDLVTRDDSRNFVAEIRVNGTSVATFTNPSGASGPADVVHSINMLGGSKNIELIWPYGDGMDLTNIIVTAGASVSAPSRPSGKIICQGDSITHGFWATRATQSWAFKLAEAKSRQLINLGYGGRAANASDANALAGTGADRVLYMIGFNNFYPNTGVVAFQTAVQGWITNARAALPSAKLYLLSPIYSTKLAADYGHATELQAYRDSVLAAEAAAGDAETYYVDGLSLMTNSADRLSDGIHPNDLGSSEIATALESIIAS